MKKKYDNQLAATKNLFGLALEGPNYILPYFHHFRSQHKVVTQTPEGESEVRNTEFKAQFSLLTTLVNTLGTDKLKLHASYTQVFFWQLYVNSAYFRETNYHPRLFIRYFMNDSIQFAGGFEHQSNGKGGTYERSLNKIFAHIDYSTVNFWIGFRPWIYVMENNSIDKYNADIKKYTGHCNLHFGYKVHKWKLSLRIANFLESGFERGQAELNVSRPIKKKLQIFVQMFHGYGQSLIEYNRKSFSAGLGLAINNWI